MRKRKPPTLGAQIAALAAKSTIEGYAARQPKTGIEEDGSYETRDGRAYDPETKRLRKRRKLRSARPEPLPPGEVPPRRYPNHA